MEKTELTIAAPCTAEWRKMKPSDGGRFCGDCKKVVRDLSTMQERDARSLLRSAGNGELCVRYLYDRHGKIFFAGDQAPLVPASFLQRAKRAALTAAAVALPLSLQACSPSSGSLSHADLQADPHANQDSQHDELHELMGGISAPDDRGDAGAEGGAADAGGDAAPSNDGGSDAAGDAEPPI